MKIILELFRAFLELTSFLTEIYQVRPWILGNERYMRIGKRSSFIGHDDQSIVKQPPLLVHPLNSWNLEIAMPGHAVGRVDIKTALRPYHLMYSEKSSACRLSGYCVWQLVQYSFYTRRAMCNTLYQLVDTNPRKQFEKCAARSRVWNLRHE